MERVADRNVVHPQERRVLDKVVRQQLLCLKAGREDGGVQVIRRATGELGVRARARCHVVVDVVAGVRPQHEAQVEVTRRQVVRQAKNPLRGGVVKRPAVIHIDDPVAVPVHVHLERVGAVNRLSARIVLLLVDEEGADRLTRNEDLDGAADTARDATSQDLLGLGVAGVRIDAGQPIRVVAGGQRDAPPEVAGASRLEHARVETQLEPRVAHAPDVRRHRRGQTAGWSRNSEDQAAGFLTVPIQGPADAIAE